jgi:hypothetical protein
MNLMTVQTNDDPPQVQIRPGFWFDPANRKGGRGRERTAFAAADFKAYDPAAHRFPARTRVIPVQTNIDLAYLLEAGDVVTLAPTVLGGGQKPLQMCVRFSADDAFPETITSPGWPWNVTNRYFAFSESMPDDWNPTNKNFHLLCWPCWTPEVDLSSLRTDDAWRQQRLGWVLPWGNAFATGFQPDVNDDRVITFGLGTTDAGISATIDAVHAGEQPGWQQPAAPVGLTQANILPPDGNPWLDDGMLSAALPVRTDQPVFVRTYGLVEIGGEVFAYQYDRAADIADRDRMDAAKDPVMNNQAWLIGRGLLGSVRRAHQGLELVLHLPLGPVAEVIDGVALQRQGRVQFSGSFSAPAMLLTSRNGGVHELTTMPDSHTAPWLRGMYNTEPVAWVPKATPLPDLAPLAIGWWPRYPSGLPKRTFDSSWNAGEFAALLRCRSYAWAGFPLRFHDSYFTPGAAWVTVFDNGGGLFMVSALALDGSLDWNSASPITLLAGGPIYESQRQKDASGAFILGGSPFTTEAGEATGLAGYQHEAAPRAVDGAELRVVWSYHRAELSGSAAANAWLIEAARNGNRAPMLGPVRLRAHAPSKVISVER